MKSWIRLVPRYRQSSITAIFNMIWNCLERLVHHFRTLKEFSVGPNFQTELWEQKCYFLFPPFSKKIVFQSEHRKQWHSVKLCLWMTQLALIVFKALNAFNLECSLSSERVFAVIICMFFLCFYSLSSGCLPFSLIYIFTIEGKGSPYSITERRVPELIPVLCSQPAGDTCHKPVGRLPLFFARPAVTLATLKRAATNFTACLRLLPESVMAAVWTQALLCLSPAC